jgi:hypothetical protein
LSALLALGFWLFVTVLFHEAGHVVAARPFGFRFRGFDTNGGFGVLQERFPARGLGRFETAAISSGGPLASLLLAAFVWHYGLSDAHLLGFPVVATGNVVLALLCVLPYGDSDGRKILDSVVA